MKKLLDFYKEDGQERVGFVLLDNSVIEVQNTHPNPDNHFDVSAADLIEYEDKIAGTWHTHPGKNSNLSVDDQAAFAMYPEATHYIIGNDGVRSYRFEGHSLVQTHET